MDRFPNMYLKFKESSYIIPSSSFFKNSTYALRIKGRTPTRRKLSKEYLLKSCWSDCLGLVIRSSHSDGRPRFESFLISGFETIDVTAILPETCTSETFKVVVDFLCTGNVPHTSREDIFEILNIAQKLEMDALCISLVIDICDGIRRCCPSPIKALLASEQLDLGVAERLVKVAKEVLTSKVNLFHPNDLAGLPIQVLCQVLIAAKATDSDKITSEPLVAAASSREKLTTHEASLILECAKHVIILPTDMPILSQLAHQQGFEILLESFFIPKMIRDFRKIPLASFLHLPLKILLKVLEADDLSVVCEDEVYYVIKNYVLKCPHTQLSQNSAEALWQKCRLLWLSQRTLQEVCMDKTVPPELIRFVLAGLSCMQSGIESLLLLIKNSEEDSWRHCLVPRKLEHHYISAASFSKTLDLKSNNLSASEDQISSQEVQAVSSDHTINFNESFSKIFSEDKTLNEELLSATAAIEKFEVIDDYISVAEKKCEREIDQMVVFSQQANNNEVQQLRDVYWHWLSDYVEPTMDNLYSMHILERCDFISDSSDRSKEKTFMKKFLSNKIEIDYIAL